MKLVDFFFFFFDKGMKEDLARKLIHQLAEKLHKRGKVHR
jgi:hypothetical protein